MASCNQFFDDLFWLFLDRIVMGICRSTDPARQGRNENLTFDLVALLAKPQLEPDDVIRLEGVLQELNRLSEEVRPWRRKLIAHLDHGVAMGQCDLKRSTAKSNIKDFFYQAECFFEIVGRGRPRTRCKFTGLAPEGRYGVR